MSGPNPSYRGHKARNQAVVTLRDADTGHRKDYYLGPYDSAESRERYHHVLAQWEANGRRLPEQAKAAEPTTNSGPTVSRVILEYWQHVQAYYVKPDGRPTTTQGHTKLALTAGLSHLIQVR